MQLVRFTSRPCELQQQIDCPGRCQAEHSCHANPEVQGTGGHEVLHSEKKHEWEQKDVQVVQHAPDAGAARHQRNQDGRDASCGPLPVHLYQHGRHRPDRGDNLHEVHGHPVAGNVEAGQLVDATVAHHREVPELEDGQQE
jgi:hypothetical protein